MIKPFSLTTRIVLSAGLVLLVILGVWLAAPDRPEPAAMAPPASTAGDAARAVPPPPPERKAEPTMSPPLATAPAPTPAVAPVRKRWLSESELRESYRGAVRQTHQRFLERNRVRMEAKLKEMGLSPEDIEIVLEIVTDDMLAGALATMMVGNGARATADDIAVFHAENKDILKDLLGDERLPQLDELRENAFLLDNSMEALTAIKGKGSALSPVGEAGTMALVDTMYSNGMIGDMVSAGQPMSLEMETAIRTMRAGMWEDWLKGEGANVSAPERLRIRKWFDKTTQEDLSHAKKVLRLLNTPKGG